ncbi:MAG: hypothetical protein C0525_07165 [Flavobacterium sp.]|nr:hypothetical protein [Flavobacterium sp.]
MSGKDSFIFRKLQRNSLNQKNVKVYCQQIRLSKFVLTLKPINILSMRSNSLLLIALFSMFLSCQKQAESQPSSQDSIAKMDSLVKEAAHHARKSLDYIGTYKGVLPCADCEGLETVLCINENNTYKLQTRYLGKGDKVFEQKGTFTWDANGVKIILNGIDNAPNQYFVGENKITQLDLSGKLITGKLALQYVLSKQSSEVQTDVTDNSNATKVNLNNRMEAQTIIKKVNPAVGKATLAETKWRLMTLNGKIVKQNGSKDYFIKLNSKDGRFTAYAGCNNIAGSYVMPSAFGLSFSNATMTRMACPNMELESRFAKALEQTDRYSLKDNILKFQKGKTTVLATFEPIN